MIEDKYSELELKLREEIERSFNGVIVTPSASRLDTSQSGAPQHGISLSVTGQPFREFVKSAGQPFDTEQEGYNAAMVAFRAYAKGRKGVLYWRVYPEIERGRFYMRLLISDKPPLASGQEMS
jgi:hypothetical protein